MAELFQFKGIKARRLQVDAIRLELLNALRSEGTAVKRELGKAVETWDHKPRFEVLRSLTGEAASILVGPVGDEETVQIYRWVTEGTRPHLILPRNKPRLTFKPGSTPKTRPGIVGSGPGAPGVGWRSAAAVHHPGTKAREFEKIVQKNRQGPFKRAMEAAIMRGARKAFG